MADQLLQHADIRRRAAFLSQGVGRFMVIIQMAMGGMEGAIASSQFGVAATQARLVIWECMAIRAIPRGGEIAWPRDAVSFDPFVFATPQEHADITALLSTTAAIASGDTSDISVWQQAVKRFARETEDLLGIDGGVPILRSSDQMFKALRLTQGVFEVLDSLSLPSPLPAQWADPAVAHETSS